MASRLQRACEALTARCAAIDHGTVAVLWPIQDWLRVALPRVSRKIALEQPSLRGAQLLIDADPSAVPATRAAVRALLDFVAQSTLRDPVALADQVSSLAWALAVYRLPDDGCDACQGDLEAWVTAERELVLVCDFLGCTQPVDSDIVAKSSRTPASRRDVLQHFPDADLLAAGLSSGSNNV